MTIRFPAAVNCSMAFTHLPLLERPAAARAAGWERVEFAWPFETATPDAAEVAAFDRALDDADVELTSFNFFGADFAHGDRGILSWPDRYDEAVASSDLALRIGARHGCRVHNTMYGNRRPDLDPDAQEIAAARAYETIADLADRLPSPPALLVETLSGIPATSLPDIPTALAVVERIAGMTGIELGIIADVFHMGAAEPDVLAAVRSLGPRLQHVQIADRPGRGAPGSGAIDFVAFVGLLEELGYAGAVSLEFFGGAETAAALAAMPEDFRARLAIGRN